MAQETDLQADGAQPAADSPPSAAASPADDSPPASPSAGDSPASDASAASDTSPSSAASPPSSDSAPASDSPPADDSPPPAADESPADDSPPPAADESPPAAADESPPAAADESPPAAADESPPAAADESPPAAADESPAEDSTAAPASPAFTSVSVEMDPDDGVDHHVHSVQVAADVKLTLKWETSDATGVHIDGLGDFDASSSEGVPIPTNDASYSLVAKGDGDAASEPWPLEVHVHDPSQVVSPHVDLGSGVAGVVSFNATKDGEPISKAKVGDTIDLTLVVSDATETAKIADQDADLTDTADGNKRATQSVTLTADMSGGFEAQALKDGQVADTGTVQLDIASDAAPVPHLSADPPGPVASNTAITLQWTIDNFVLSGTTAQISADADPGDANFTFASQDVHLAADGSGSQSVTPTNPGDFNFTLKVTPPDGSAVSSDPLQVTVQAAPAAPVPHLESDASGPVAPNTAINLKWTMDNFVSGTTAQISADADPGDANFTFGGQDVTLESDGSGTLAVTPTNAGDFNFRLKVTPPDGPAVSTDPLKVTLQAAAPAAPVPHLTSDASGPVAPNTAITLQWTIDNFVAGMTAQISADADPGDPNFTFSGQDVTLGADGSGTLAITPTNPGDFNFTLKVTSPQG